jgi:WD40 repeat protein
MRRVTLLSMLIILVCTFTVTQAQTADTDTGFPELELITLENAARLVQLPGELTSVNEGFDVSPDGKQIAVAQPDGVYVYDMGSFEMPASIFQIPDADDVYGPQFSPDGKLLAISTIGLGIEDEITQLWTLHTKTILQEFRTGSPLNGGAIFSPDGAFLGGYTATCQGGCDTASTLFAWSIDNPAEPLCSFYNCYGRYGIGDFAFTPDSKILFWNIYDYVMRGDPYEYFWRIEYLSSEADDGVTDGLMNHFQGQTGPFAGDITSIWFSPDGSQLVAYNREQNLTSLWDVETGTEILVLPQDIRITAFLPDQTILVVDDTQHTASILQVETGEQVTLFENLGEQEFISPANPDSTLLVSWENFETVHFYGIPTESE